MTKRPRSAAKKEATSKLIEALKFVSVAQHEAGTPHQTHCIIANSEVIAFDGVLAAGMKIDENVSFCPHTGRFIDALSKCGQNFAITQLDQTKIAVKTDRFKAFIPCVPRELLPGAAPDPALVKLDDRLKQALEAVSGLVSENAQHIVTAAVLVRSGSAVATDRQLMLECWHGQDLPVMRLPKAAVTAICKAGKSLASFGYNGTTATFYFEDGSWIRTQLFIEPYPDVDRILNVKVNPWPVPQNFFDGVRAIAPFNEGMVFFGQNILRSHDADNIGATYEVAGIPKGVRLKAKHLLAAEPYMKHVDFVGANGITYFFGTNVRGVITQIAKTTEEKMREWRENGSNPDEIPY